MGKIVDDVCHAIASLVWFYPNLSGYKYMARAFVGLLLIAPLCSTIGIQVVNFRLAFFAEAVGHSAFTGIAIGFMLAALPVFAGAASWATLLSMIGFGVLVGFGITFYRRNSALSSDTVIGVFSTTVVAIGLCAISYMIRTNVMQKNALWNFLMGSIVTVGPGEVLALAIFFVAAMTFQFFAYNRLMFIGLNADQAHTMGVRVALYEYVFAVLLALVVMFSIKAVGVLLVTAMLVIPAAAARNLARSAGSVFWWGLLIALSSSVVGLILSDQYSTATGATTILCCTTWFVLAGLIARFLGH